MDDKKFEISSIAIGILSFILIFFGFMEGVLLLLGFSILIQKDYWLTKQALQALYLRIVYLVGILVVGWIFKGILFILDLVDAYKAREYVLAIRGFLEGAIYICFLVFVVVSVMKLLKGQDAGIPLVNSFAARTLGVEGAKGNRNQHVGMYQGQGTAPQEKNSWKCSCGTENFGKFCVSCGQEKEESEVSS